MTTKIVQALEAIIEFHFDDRSDEHKADLLDDMIDEILRKEEGEGREEKAKRCNSLSTFPNEYERKRITKRDC